MHDAGVLHSARQQQHWQHVRTSFEPLDGAPAGRAHAHARGVCGCTHLKQLDNALVREVQHDADFPLDALGLVGVGQLGLVNDLDRHLAPTQVVHRQAYLQWFSKSKRCSS